MSAPSSVLGVGLAFPSSYQNPTEQKKAATRCLNGLKRQVEILASGTKTIDIGKDEQGHKHWDNNLQKILNLMTNSQKLVVVPKSKELTLPEQLKNQDKPCAQIIKDCEGIQAEFAVNMQGRQAIAGTSQQLECLKADREALTPVIKEKNSKNGGAALLV